MKLPYISLLLLLIGFAYGCKSSSSVLDKSIYPYHQRLLPQHRVIFINDTATLFWDVEMVEYKLTIECRDVEDPSIILYQQTDTFDILDPKSQDLKIPISNPDFILDLTILEMENLSVYQDREKIEKNKSDEQSIRAKLPNGTWLQRNYLSCNSEVIFYHNDPEVTELIVKFYPGFFRAAPPPFSTKGLKFNPRNGSADQFYIKPGTPFHIREHGLYFVHSDSLGEEGIFLNCFQEDFPRVTEIEDLLQSIRYIAKNQEYDTLVSEPNSKFLLDEFWLDRGGSEQRARELISAFYNRIQQANLFFSTYKEGWKTDRGLIYTIFGPPEKAFKYENEEIWYYPETKKREEVYFYFDKISQQLLLRRTPELKQAWNVEIYNWRNGIIN